MVVALIVALPGLGSIRSRLAHESPVWLVLAAGFRLLSALAYVVLFRAIFAPKMSHRLSYQIAMSEIGLNALVPAGGAGGLATGGWVLHRRGMPTDEVVERSTQFFVFTSAFNVGAVAILGWLGAVGILASHGSFALSAVPALAATLVIVLALALVPRLAGLQAGRGRLRSHSLKWWLLEAAVALGTGARGAIDLFRRRDPHALLGGAGYLVFDIAVPVGDRARLPRASRGTAPRHGVPGRAARGRDPRPGRDRCGRWRADRRARALRRAGVYRHRGSARLPRDRPSACRCCSAASPRSASPAPS